MLNYKVILCKNKEKQDWIVFLHGLGGSSKIWYKQWDFFKKHYNLLLVDFYGHGDTTESLDSYDFLSVASSIIEILDHLNIVKAHFMGISLGSLIGMAIGNYYPERVNSLVLGGAAIRFTRTTTSLLYLSYVLKSVLPYMLLYKIFAWIIMPKRNHKKSRLVFVREATKLGRKEFLKWHKLLASYRNICDKITNNIFGKLPKIFISGEEDHLFVDDVVAYAKADPLAEIFLIKRCGHVCNVEKHDQFNKTALAYLQELDRQQPFECLDNKYSQSLVANLLI